MEAVAVAAAVVAEEQQLRAGSRVPVTVDQILQNDTLVVTLTYLERSFTGILLDCNKKTGLFCLPDLTRKARDCPIPAPAYEIPAFLSEEPVSELPSQASRRPKDENTLPENDMATGAPLPCPVPTPVPAGQTTYPPYFEGAPFPRPLWVRHSYSQWIPQPPPRPIKRRKRRTREPGRMTMSTIRLRPRQVLCEKCKNTLNNNSDEDSSSKDGVSSNTKASRKENAPQSDDGGGGDEAKDGPAKVAKKEAILLRRAAKRRENGGAAGFDASKRLRKEKRGGGEAEGEKKFPGGEIVIPHSPVIKISYSTPQGKGEVIKIPARVHGSVKPFCPKQLVQNGFGATNGKTPTVDPAKEQQRRHILDATRSGLTVSIPKLKLTRPFTTLGQGGLPSSPKIRLRPPPRRDGGGGGEDSTGEYEAPGLVVARSPRRAPHAGGLPHSEDSGEGKNNSLDSLWSEEGSVEEGGADGGGGPHRRHHHHHHGDLTLLINFRKRKADSSSLSVCSSSGSDSLEDESKSCSSSDGTSSPSELCEDLAPGVSEDVSVSSSSVVAAAAAAAPSSHDADDVVRSNKTVPPITVRLHTRSMTKCVTEEGHAVAVGDVVWGKIHGFPWWPARVLNISGGGGGSRATQETTTTTASRGEAAAQQQWPEAKVAWFGSPTTSQLSVAKLSPFRELFRSRFNRKKKGMYRRAILEAAKAVGHMGPEVTSLLSHCET